MTKGSPGEQEIAALTGATVSSRTMTDSANVALEVAALVMKGEG